jgi:hypothetical protein
MSSDTHILAANGKGIRYKRTMFRRWLHKGPFLRQRVKHGCLLGSTMTLCLAPGCQHHPLWIHSQGCPGKRFGVFSTYQFSSFN